MNNSFDLDKCHARLVKNPLLQCNNNKKYGNLCGTHSKSSNLLLITDNLNTSINNITPTTSSLQVNLDTNINDLTNNFANNFNLNSEFYSRNLNSIVKIQSILRSYLIRKKIKLHGISAFNRKLLNNDADFLTFENISDLPISDLFTFKDSSGKYWGFHIATFKELIKTEPITNPYNTLLIDSNIIDNFKKLLYISEKTNKIEILQDNITNPDIKLQQKCISVFQKMDNLKQYTQCEWFLNLNLTYLKQLYKYMEDMWNYRIGLTHQQRLRYVTDGKLFTENMNNIYRMNDRYKLSHILLNDFDRLISEGHTEADKATGSLWILSGLTLVSSDARNALPWLYSAAY
jgi:hypothetical protein